MATTSAGKASSSANGGHGAAEDQFELVVGEQGRRGPSRRPLGVTDRLGDVPVLLVPASGAAWSERMSAGLDAPQLEAQKIAEQRVGAEPQRPTSSAVTKALALSSSAGSRSDPEPPVSASAVGTADALEHRRPQQQVAHLGRLPLEHLRPQIVRNRALGAAELAHERFRIGMAGERPAASRSPAAQPSVRSCSDSTAASDSAMPDASSSSAPPAPRNAGPPAGARSTPPSDAGDEARARGRRASPAPRAGAPAAVSGRTRATPARRPSAARGHRR